ncbi:hypothetical protein ABEF92_008513 [Exophiala dermatitidis]|uniref:Uncharacterized protein n=1 Tax=Exophiala dermatitidis (strain ATCC 34100 / CBS 525.76 / NIH/UT8656) TaxID=858893 RepID=H6C557_EXODN|nr:uncharacterized protein HMPREF1120_07752 [Exophiala dermatitidis NIH/UT8656]EHY59769.1 hypothetical protein HMPREF1120_07752 [Exophiala dermatitidis NIH/UT8656]
MGAVSVASVVASIISAFGSGMEILHRLGVGKHKKSRCRARPPQPWEEAEWESVQESLQSRPLQIKHEYDQSVGRFGRRFEVGDSTAHSSLAQTLLVLNTGLIKLINHALSDNQSKENVMSSNKALFSLSEAAASDTMAALEQLRTRLSVMAPRRPLVRIPLQNHQAEEEEEGQNRIGRHDRHHQTHQESSLSLSLPEKRPQQQQQSRASTALLVRGGWVRSKNGGTSSVVLPSAPAAVRKGAKRARKTDQNQDSTTSSQSKSSSGSTATMRTRTRTQTRTPVFPQLEPGRHAGNQTGNETSRCVSPDRVRRHRQESLKHDALAVLDHDGDSKPQRQPSMLIVPSDFFELQVVSAVQVHPEQSCGRRRDPPPPRPPKIPLDSKPPPPPPPPPRRAFIDGGRRAPRPTSTMTFMTASTKIGEIPESRWQGQGKILPISAEGHADNNKTWVPADTLPPPLEPLGNGAKTTKKSCFKFWRRDGKG